MMDDVQSGCSIEHPSQWMSAPLVGTDSQIEWATSIRVRVNDEFERVASAIRSVADRQDPRKRSHSEAILAILEEKRIEVLGQDSAGYFIRVWRDLDDQVRQILAKDSRYQAIRADKTLIGAK